MKKTIPFLLFTLAFFCIHAAEMVNGASISGFAPSNAPQVQQAVAVGGGGNRGLAASPNFVEADTYPLLPSSGRLLDMLALLPQPEEVRWQFSSHACESRYDADSGRYLEWGRNTDFWNRRNPNNVLKPLGGNRYLLAEVDGPGVLSWIWTAVAAQKEKQPDYSVYVYLDNMNTPAFSGSWQTLLSGKIPLLAHSGLVYAEDKTCDSFLPIPFNRKLKIVAERADDSGFDLPSFYILAGERMPKGDFPSFDQPAYQQKLSAMGAFLEKNTGAESFDARRVARRESLTFSLSPGSENVIFEDTGASSVLALKIKYRGNLDWKESAQSLRGLILEARWEGEREPAVWSPIDAFFGMSPGLHPYKSYPMGADDAGNMYCYFPMPYRKGARISIRNIGSQTQTLSSEVVSGIMPRTSDCYGYFHARWHPTDFPASPKDRWMDKSILNTRGRGRVVGVHLHIWNPLGGWWGEGDEKIFVDGEKFPSIFGTGTEDFLGFCYGYPKYKSKPFHNVNFNQYEGKGHQSLNRYLMVDSVPFQNSVDFYLERYNEIQYGRMTRAWVDARESSVKLAVVPYWYGDRPFAAENYRTYNLDELSGWYALEPKVFEPGAVEIETQKPKVSGGKTRLHYWSWMEWSGDAQLVWEGASSGDVLTLPIKISRDGTYALHIRMNRHSGYGEFDVSFGDQSQQVNLDWNGREWQACDVVFAPRELKAGVFDLRITARTPGGHNSAIAGAFDYYKLINK